MKEIISTKTFTETICSAKPITQERLNDLMAQRIKESMDTISNMVTKLADVHHSLSGMYDILTYTGEEGECHE